MTLISKAWIRTISTQEETKYTFCGALEYRYKHIAANWNDDTRRKYEREYNDIILPALDNHNGKCIDEYTREDYENAIDYIRERSFERNGLKRHYAESTIRHFQNLIYYVVFQSAVYGLCENVLWGTSFVINIPDEQEELESRVRIKKSLSVNQEKQLYQELFSDPNEDGALVALMLMWGLGLRNGEACGLDYCDIKPIEGHTDCYAAWIYKSTKIESNELQSGGKTYNTGRIVPVPDKILVFLEKRKEIIRKLAFGQSKSEVNVDELPICNAGWLDYDPFADGNGRTGRLWHTLILSKWQEFFLWIPIESIIHERQDGYYKALNASNTAGESTIFVEFMLELIRDLLKELASGRAFATEKTTGEKVMDLIKEDGKMSAAKIAERLGLSQRQVQRVIKQLKDDGVIEYVGANRNGYYKIIK